jgi:HEAT repeat protein
VAAPGFGASDCRCSAHLVSLPALPDESWLTDQLGAERIIVGNDDQDELLRVLATPDEGTRGGDEVREAAALALGRYGAQAVRPLVALLEQDDGDTRWWAARALAAVGGDGAMALLTGALADADADVRACAALGLGRIGDGAAAPALAAALADESRFVSSIASDALSMIGGPAVEALAGELVHKHAHVRLLAVRALSRIGTASTTGPLLGMLEDPSYLVRYYAQEALESLGVGMVYVTL